jgi:hypothetical protein
MVSEEVTALHSAAEQDDLTQVEALIAKGVDPMSRDPAFVCTWLCLVSLTPAEQPNHTSYRCSNGSYSFGHFSYRMLFCAS